MLGTGVPSQGLKAETECVLISPHPLSFPWATTPLDSTVQMLPLQDMNFFPKCAPPAVLMAGGCVAPSPVYVLLTGGLAFSSISWADTYLRRAYEMMGDQPNGTGYHRRQREGCSRWLLA